MPVEEAASGPQFVMVTGERAGRVFRLRRPPPGEGWSLGREPAADVRLTDDPYIAARHARVLEREGAHVLVARERTFHNWRLMGPGTEAALAMGDLVGMGMTLLVYQPG